MGARSRSIGTHLAARSPAVQLAVLVAGTTDPIVQRREFVLVESLQFTWLGRPEQFLLRFVQHGSQLRIHRSSPGRWVIGSVELFECVDEQTGAETAHTASLPPLRADGRCHTGDVDMGPRHAFGEVREELGRGGGARIHPAEVLHVGDVGVEFGPVVRAHGKLPDGLAGCVARRSDDVDQRLVGAHHAGDVGAERPHARSGQGGDVDDRVGFDLRGHDDGIGHHQTPLRIGVEHLDGRAVAMGDDVTHLHRRARGHVVGAHDVGGHLRRHRQVVQYEHRREHRAAAGHVVLHHGVHHVARFDGETAGVVGEALADEYDVTAVGHGLVRRVGQRDQAWFLVASTVDGDDAAATLREEPLTVVDLDTEAELRSQHVERRRPSGAR